MLDLIPYELAGGSFFFPCSCNKWVLLTGNMQYFVQQRTPFKVWFSIGGFSKSVFQFFVIRSIIHNVPVIELPDMPKGRTFAKVRFLKWNAVTLPIKCAIKTYYDPKIDMLLI